MNKYKVVLFDGKEKEVSASGYYIDHGNVHFVNNENLTTTNVAYYANVLSVVLSK